jgi:hypothetical protein
MVPLLVMHYVSYVPLEIIDALSISIKENPWSMTCEWRSVSGSG